MNVVAWTLLGFVFFNCREVSLPADGAGEAEKIAERLLGEAQDAAEEVEERYNLATDKALALVTVAFGWRDAGMEARADAAFARVAEIAARNAVGYSPHTVWKRLAVEHARRGDVDAALKVHQQIADPENRSRSLEELIRTFLAYRNSAAAVTTALELPTSALGGGNPRESALQSIVKWQAENGEVAGAPGTMKLIESDWLRAPALTAIAVAQARQGKSASGAQTLGEIHAGYRVPALVAFGEASAGAGDRAAARSAFEQATVLAQTLRDFNGARGSPVLQALATIARAQWAAGETEAARETVELARTISGDAGGDRAINQSVLARAEAGVGDFDQAMARVDAFRGTEQRWWRAAVCTSIAAAAAASGQQERAESAFARAAAETAALKPASSRRRALQTLSRALLQTGRIDAATKTASKLPSSDRDDLFREIIAVHSRQGNVPEALSLTKSISGAWTLRLARELIAIAQFRGGDLAAALEMAPDDTAKPGSALREILEAQMVAHNADGALQTFRRIQLSIGSEPELIADVAAIQVRGGDWKAAYAWATGQTSPDRKAHALVGVARGLLRK
ncbi:MAG: hypothetical protein QOE70_5661 [Chthoniobacter sp.]|jgi:tetratricopeptide (TPR) repeat protein|nr:hypothetical protein [Chthoniobacter sp.]